MNGLILEIMEGQNFNIKAKVIRMYSKYFKLYFYILILVGLSVFSQEYLAEVVLYFLYVLRSQGWLLYVYTPYYFYVIFSSQTRPR
jgi:hypothetical protein